MTDDHRRRLTDKLSEGDTMEILMELHAQRDSITKIENSLIELRALPNEMTRIKTLLEGLLKDNETAMISNTVVSWHDKLLKMLAGVCVLLFPMIIGWATSLQSQLMALEAETKLLELKLQYMEKSHVITPSTPPTTDAHLESRDFWVIDYSTEFKF